MLLDVQAMGGPTATMPGLGATSRADGFDKPRLLNRHYIASRLRRHNNFKYHNTANTALVKDGIIEATEPLVPESPAAPSEPTPIDLASAAAKKEKALRRLPLSLTALYLGAKGRPAADYQDTCILVQRSAGAIDLIYLPLCPRKKECQITYFSQFKQIFLEWPSTGNM